ncbi:short-chain dehydrogenase/reductase [Campylobacter lari]|uniref:SDR family NAD(P)-dependent oxidoreductase n=1 Tax=Campylobacter lari TaxID=201 RepID=UPI002152ACBB|nr:SDR family oxidoreductase [Campylobacter lari]MCR6538022.1 SDR family oxidoreductase [Campylobacter lari]
MQDKVILITGTRKGIGKFLSEYYLQKGYVVCGCSRGEASINHQKYHHYVLDVCDEMAVVKMIREVKKKYNRIDILLNNAGIASMNHILTTPYQSVQNIFNTNFFGSFLFIREVAKIMSVNYSKSRNNEEGSEYYKNMPFRIVNFTTVATPLRLEGEAAYAASKAAIVNFTQVCAKELAEFGITVNAVGPTPIPTDLIKNVSKNKIESLLNQQAIKRFGSFGDVLNAIEFFLDEKSNFITGQIIYLGGVNG